MTTTSEPEQGQRKPGRPRSAQAHKAIFQVFLTQLLIPRIQQFIHMTEQAQSRNEIRKDIDWTLALDLVSGPMFFHLLITRFLAPPMSASDDKWVEQMIDAVMQGIGTK
jgi:Tetracyclin repressor-like, C-terminal domain